MRILADKKFTHTAFGTTTEVFIHVATYGNGRLALQLTCPMEGVPNALEPYMTPTVNLPDEECGPGEVYVKDWSENEGITEWLIKNELIQAPPVGGAATGYVFARRFKLTQTTLAACLDALSRGKLKKQRGDAVGDFALAILIVAIAVAQAVYMHQVQEELRTVRHSAALMHSRLTLMTCEGDMECQHACEAVYGLQHGCDDVLGPVKEVE